MGSDRPKVIQCKDCGVDVPVHPRGQLPHRCPEHKQARLKQQREAWRKTDPQPRIKIGKDELALRTTDMRLAIEQAIPLLNMALLKPYAGNVYIKQAIEHLEMGRGGAKVDIRDKTDISAIPDIIELSKPYQGDNYA